MKDITLQHTPAPWKLNAESWGYIQDTDGQPVASASPRQECLANARLIAEAPAMLKALISAYTIMERNNFDVKCEFMRKMERIINRATGQEEGK